MKEGEFLGDWRPGRVAIFGAGQVGTMIGLALKEQGVAGEISVYDPNRQALEASRARGLPAGEALDPDVAFDRSDASVVVLAAPVPRIVELVGRVGPQLGPHTLLIDTGSAKVAVVEAMRRLPSTVHAIGGHPMAGTEVPGPAGARPELLAGAPFALTPVRDDPVALARGRSFAQALGARPVVISAEEHDRVVARTSHLPHIVAFALSMVAADAGSPRVVSDLTGTGLRRAIRLAASDPKMVAGFLSANGDEVRAALADLRRALAVIETALDDGPAPLAEVLSEAGRVREVVGS